jgi:iron complex outermembrane receptor protein
MQKGYLIAASAVLTVAIEANPLMALAQNAPNQAAVNNGTELEEIVITAQKQPEKLQDVPVAAVVISSETLANANLADLSDLNNLVPSVQLNGTINGRVPTGIRGISSVSNEQTVGISSGVAINIDGVPVPSDSFDANNIAGIQSVEVLLGPQSTLGGRTAASGLINLTTRGPTDEFGGFATTTATDDGEYRVEAFLSGPIVDRLDGSLSVYKSTTPYPITNLATGDKTTQDVSGFRGKLLFKVTDDLSVSLMTHYENTEGRGMNFVYTYITPGAPLLGAPVLSQAILLPGITPSMTNLNYSSPVTTAGGSHRDKDASLIIEDKLPGGYTLTSTTAYQYEDQHQVQDLFTVNEYFWNVLTGGHAPPFYDTQSQDTTVTQSSEELKLASPTDLPVSFLVGAFLSYTKVDELYVRTLLPAELDDHVISDTKTYDLYGRATWKITPSTSLIPGLRFNHDEIGYQYEEVVDAVVFPTEVVGPYYSASSSSANTVVGDIALKQQLTDNVMAYASYSRGYSPAAYNTSAVLFSNDPLAPVGKESINSYEIGVKGSFLDRKLIANADLFDTVYSHYQIQSYSSVAGAITPPLQLESVGKAETKGLEANVDWLATSLTRVSLSAAYIDAKFVVYDNAPCYGTGAAIQTVGCVTEVVSGQSQQVQNVSGDTMPNSPKFKGTLAVDQRVPLGTLPYELVLSGTFSYRTSAQMLPDQNPYAIQAGFGLLNLSGTVQTHDGKYSARLFVNNVTNHHYYTDIEDFWTGPWSSNAVIGQPARDAERYAGIKFTVNF